LVTDFKISGLVVKLIRYNDSEENKVLFDECRFKGYNVKFEFSGLQTPQCNGKVERKFQTFFGRIRAMLNSASVKDQLRSGVWAEFAITVMFFLMFHQSRIRKSVLMNSYLGASQSC
jgi:hypothetical protein